jgi:NMD protein affecting ribosome stability and mRNA decay
MRLAGVRPGDIVRADGMHALVLDRGRGYLVVRGLGNGSTRHVKAGDVEAHWRRAADRTGREHVR